MSAADGDEAAALLAGLVNARPDWLPEVGQMLPTDLAGSSDEAVLLMLQAMEAEVHAHGWGKPSQLGVTFARSPEPGSTIGHLGISTFMDPFEAHPLSWVVGLAKFLASEPRAAVALAGHVLGVPVGMAVCAEVWGLPPGAVDDGRPFAERDDRVDSRVLWYGDMYGNETQIQRVGNQPPQFVQVAGPPVAKALSILTEILYVAYVDPERVAALQPDAEAGPPAAEAGHRPPAQRRGGNGQRGRGKGRRR